MDTGRQQAIKPRHDTTYLQSSLPNDRNRKDCINIRISSSS